MALALSALPGLRCADADRGGPTERREANASAPAVPPAVAGSSGPFAQPPAAARHGAHFVDQLDVRVFQKGNLHTHTTRSDGDTPPKDVYGWYWRHGYQFLAITDHNFLTPPARQRAGFVAIPGEEITMVVSGRPVHVNALCIKRRIPGGVYPDISAALRSSVAATLAQNGVALINHPNYEWALQADDVTFGHGAQLLEIWSGHPSVHSDGDAFHLSQEAIWDKVLDNGEQFAAVAVDDLHAIKRSAPEPAARGGKGWVEVFAAETREQPICEALRAKRLYASNGVKLARIAVAPDAFTVWPEAPDTITEFVGEGGVILDRIDHATPEDGATYRPRDNERYVRARVTGANGAHAWTQPYRVER